MSEERLRNLCQESSWLALEFKSCDLCYLVFTHQYTKNRDELCADQVDKQIKEKTAIKRPYNLRTHFPDLVLPLTRKRMSSEMFRAMLPYNDRSTSDLISAEKGMFLATKSSLPDINEQDYQNGTKKPLKTQESQPSYYLKEFLYHQDQSHKLLNRLKNARSSAATAIDFSSRIKASPRDSSVRVPSQNPGHSSDGEGTASTKKPLFALKTEASAKKEDGHPVPKYRSARKLQKAIWLNSRPSYLIYSPRSPATRKVEFGQAGSPRARAHD